MVSLGIIGVIGTLIVIPLPETYGIRLKGNIKELQTSEENIYDS